MNYETLSNRELLTFLVGEDGAKHLYKGSLAPLFSSDTKGSTQHAPLHAARELLKRTLEEELRCRPVLSTPTAVRDYLKIHFMGQEYESFVVLFLDAKNQLIAVEDMFRGTLDQTSVFPREVVKRVLHWNGAAVVFAHNHPSGTPEPSQADRHLTKALRYALELVDVKVLDHFVIAGIETLSFAESGLLSW